MLSVKLFRVVALAFVGSVFAAPNEATIAVQRTPPPTYQANIAPLLTPFESVLAGREAMRDGESSGVILLTESIKFRDTDGVHFRIEHQVYHAYTAKGGESLGSLTYGFDKERESIFLVTAATILPGGERRPIADNGAFIQTPQREADSALYTSHAELNLVFPNVGEGATTEAIVVVRENVPVMPGEFCTRYSFSAGWPTFVDRLVIELPESDWARMRAVESFAGVGVAAVEKLPADRERRSWRHERLPRRNWEENAPAAEFRSPTIWLSTVPDWDAFSRWYHGLLAPQSNLGPELTAEVEKLTAGITDPNQIVDRLHDAVANDVRYTGLEFGLAGYQPYPCRDVWQRRYGDCKDKANLLRAMLAAKGIPAHVVLLNTASSGRVEERSPNWGQFNHAIVAVEQPGVGYRFCDPTVRHLPAGRLPIADLARAVLVVRPDRAEWVRTPDTMDSAIRTSAELSLTPDGELTGWFTLAAEGSDATFYAARYNGAERQDRMRTMQSLAEQFVPGAEVVDVDYKPTSGAVTAFKIRAFLHRAPAASAQQNLRFPYPADWLPDLHTVGDRRQPYATYRRVQSCDFTITLPEETQAGAIPAAFDAPSVAARFSARWERQGRTLSAHLAWQPEKAELSPAEYAIFRNAVRACAAWLAQPVVLQQTVTAAASDGTAASPQLTGFPLLATGEGQLNLLEEKFPAGTNDTLRRAALEQVIQWFPQDADTAFTARIHLVRLDEEKLGPKAFATKIAAIRKQAGNQPSAHLRAWAEYLELLARWEAGKDKAALERLRRLAADETLTRYRRAWCAYSAARFIGERDPVAAVKFVRPYAEFESDARRQILGFVSSALTKSGDRKGLEELLASPALKDRDDADDTLTTMLGWLADDWESYPAPAKTDAVAVWGKYLGDRPALTKASAKFTALKKSVLTHDAQLRFTNGLAAWLKAHPPAWWTKKKDPRFTDAAAVIAHIKARNEAQDATGVIDGTLQLVLQHNAPFAQFAEYLRWSVWWFAKEKRDDALADEIIRLSQDLPVTGSAEVVELWSTAAELRANRTDAAGARALYERVLGTPDVESYQCVEAAGDLGRMERSLGRFDEALAAYRRLAPIHKTHRRGADYLYAGLLLALERERFETAGEFVAQIREHDPKYIAECRNQTALEALRRAAADPAALQRYWRHAGAWRSAHWNKFLTGAGIQPGAATAAPSILDWTAHLTQVTELINARDRTGYLRALDDEARVAAAVPLVAINLVQNIIHGTHLPTAERQRLYQCLLGLLEDLPPVDAQMDDSAKLFEAALLVDVGQPMHAAEKARILYARLQGNTPLGQAALRVMGMSARTATEQKAAAAELQRLLESSTVILDRMTTLAVLSDLLENLHDVAPHLALLERETTQPTFNKSHPGATALLQRLNRLRTARNNSAALVRTIQLWLAEPNQAWLALQTPRALSESRFAGLREPLDASSPGFTVAEQIKFNLLLALDPGQPDDTRERAFVEAYFATTQATNDAVALTDAVLARADGDGLSGNARGRLLRYAVWTLAALPRPDLIERCMAHPTFATQDEVYRHSVAATVEALKLRLGNEADRHAKAFARLTTEPIDGLRRRAVFHTLQDLASAGRSVEAEALLQKAESIGVATGSNETTATLQLFWLRGIQAAAELAPLIDLLEARVAALPGATAPLSPAAERLINLEGFAGLTDEECVALVARRLHTRFGVGSTLDDLLAVLGAARSATAKDPMLGAALGECLVGLRMRDSLKSSLMFPVIGFADNDDPGQRAASLRQLDSLLTAEAKAAAPQTASAAASLRAIITVRSSSDLRPAALFDPIQTRVIPPNFLNAMRLQFYVSRGQTAESNSAVDAVDPDTVAQLRLFRLVRPLLAQAGREAEIRLYEKAVRTKFESSLGKVWVTIHEPNSWRDALAFLDTPGLKLDMPDAWFERAAAVTRHPLSLARLSVVRSKLRQDYPALKSACDTAISLSPTTYDFYLDRADAKAALGDRAGAIQDLDIFLRFALDHAEYQRAVRLRQELGDKAKS